MTKIEEDSNIPQLGEIYYSENRDIDLNPIRIVVDEVTLTPEEMQDIFNGKKLKLRKLRKRKSK